MTHGYGSVITSAGKTDKEGNLENIQKEFGNTKNSPISISEPRIYFGMETKDAVVINPNSENEFDYLDLETGNEQTYTYTGDAGLVLNFFDRIILGIKEGDLKLAFSGSVETY